MTLNKHLHEKKTLPAVTRKPVCLPQLQHSSGWSLRGPTISHPECRGWVWWWYSHGAPAWPLGYCLTRVILSTRTCRIARAIPECSGEEQNEASRRVWVTSVLTVVMSRCYLRPSSCCNMSRAFLHGRKESHRLCLWTSCTLAAL